MVRTHELSDLSSRQGRISGEQPGAARNERALGSVSAHCLVHDVLQLSKERRASFVGG